MQIPTRRLPIQFYIDTNRINAREKLPSMNQLEKWNREKVILIIVSEVVHGEACKGLNPARSKKARNYIISGMFADTQGEQEILRQIESILFPEGASNKNRANDVGIVFTAWKYKAALITNDGDSISQPGGILGHRKELKQLGIEVMRDGEAVDFVKKRIRSRDNLTRKICAKIGKPIPSWVDLD